MAEIQLKTMKFPGIEDTYTIPSIPSDIGAASAINIGTYTGDINSLDLPLNSVAYISQNAINNPFPTEGAILETWGGLDGIRVQRATRCTGHHVLVRTYVNNAWHDWAKTALVRDLPNPNLLDNWYFADPINQRGATEYTAEGFTIDRWKMSLNDAVNPSLSIGDGCIVLHNETTTGTPCSCFISQRIENPSRFAGKTITFSVKLKNVECAGEPILQIRSSSGNVRSATITSSYTNSIIKVSTTLDSSISSL